MDDPAGGYVPTVRGAARCASRMTCLAGMERDDLHLRNIRGDHDGQPVAPLPVEWSRLPAGWPPTPGSSRGLTSA